MKKTKSIATLAATAAMAVMANAPIFAQANLGASCGCPPVASRPTVLLSSLAVSGGTTDGDLLANTVLSCDKTWILDKKIYVPSGLSITIKPGTVIKGNTSATPGDATALIVTKGAKIYALGEKDCPIVFTAAADPMDGTYGVGNRGKWGGVVVLGKAQNNLVVGNTLAVSDGIGFVEGFVAATARNQYGMAPGAHDNNDNSGALQYVSIRHGGATVGPDNELNGLTLASVGSATTVDHIEVIANDDDGIEFFGGTVGLKYATVMFNNDDAFDWDQGWRGKGQFWFLVQNSQGDNGFESDGDDNKTGSAYLSNPVVYNVTVLGNTGDAGIEAKEQTEGEIYNSIMANFGTGLNLANDATRPGGTDAYDNWIAGTFKVNNCTFVGTTTPLGVPGGASATDLSKFSNDGNVVAASVPGLDFGFVIDNSTNAVSDKYNAVPSPLLATSINPPADGFFSPAAYRGAFKSGEKPWMSDWTYAQVINATTGLLPCPNDTNSDGIVSQTDLNNVLGQFGASCQ